LVPREEGEAKKEAALSTQIDGGHRRGRSAGCLGEAPAVGWKRGGCVGEATAVVWEKRRLLYYVIQISIGFR